MTRKVRIFVSYARADRKWLNELDPHIRGLQHYTHAESFDDRGLLGGEAWHARLVQELEQADIFLALLTANFVGSEYIHETELPIAKRRQDEGKCIIVPVLVDACRWQLLGIADRNVLPRYDDGGVRPIKQWRQKRSEAFTVVIEHLEKHLERMIAAAATSETSNPVTAGINLPRYRERAAKQWSAIDLGSLAAPGAGDADVNIRLTDIFVPPNARRSRPHVSVPRDWMINQGLDPQREDERAELLATEWERQTPEPALHLIARPDHPLQVILGDPGAGKSSLTRFVLLRLLDPSLPDTSPLAPLRDHLPFLVELRDFVGWEREHPAKTLLDYLHYRGTVDGFGFTAEALRDRWAQAPSLLIIDGLDEIFDVTRRGQMVNEIIGLNVTYPRMRILVTARIVGFDDHPFRAPNFTLSTLTDLSPDQVLGFGQHWFPLAFPHDPGQAERKRRELEQALERPQLRILAGNPLMLTLMATIARHRPLARSRATLYAQALDLLCHTWDDHRGLKPPTDSPLRKLTPSDLPPMLRRIAWRMQEAPDGLRANAVALEDLRLVLSAFFRDDWHFSPPEANAATEDMLERLQARNWVLTLRGSGLFGFVHRTFLEYLCALELAEQFKAQTIDADALIRNHVIPHADDETWHEVLRLLAGMLPPGVAERMILAVAPERIARGEVPTRLGLAWQVLAEVDVKSIPGLSQACRALTERLYRWCDDGAWDPHRQVQTAITDAAASIGPTSWPADCCPPDRNWPSIAQARGIFAGFYANSLALAGALANTVWGCPDVAVAYLHERAVNDKDASYVRREAISALARHFRDHADTLPLLRERAVKDEDGSVRWAAISALARHFRDHADTLPLLRERAVKDEDGSVRGVAIGALAQHFGDHADTLPLLRERAVKDGDGFARRAVIGALAQHFGDHADTLPLLRERAVKDENGSVRWAAISALAQHFRDHADTLPLLRERAVKDDDGSVRRAALLACARRSDVPQAAILCSRNLDGVEPSIDPKEPISPEFVDRAAQRLNKAESVIRGWYEQLAAELPLTLSWRAAAPSRARRAPSPHLDPRPRR